ncbi:hypothetical protein [Variovorax sp. RA8]|uniref:hypothetical protein n=1 Tax=Variovorax sp. (strain JCM 16519 / RA8) TaxID=662548 RepID=UPI0013168F8B|nr:hypothetical protein [Variovorax sp. RA8]VTU41442.1 hypothetical protein RA8P1_00003 [Variovorax sp. RA8]
MTEAAAWIDPVDAGTPDAQRDCGWPPVCTLAELARILTLVHGVRAPTESLLKKWSAAGAFRSCVAAEDEVAAAQSPSSVVQAALQRPRRAGRPGLQLSTARALARVYELWPFLADSDNQAVVELVVARTADHLRSALGQAIVATPPAPASSDGGVPGAGVAALEQIELQLAALAHDVNALKREVAQFTALRNNLITRLDDAVAHAKDALAGGRPSGVDPLVEARRDRDMGVMKSTLSEILTALQRIEADRARQ